MRNDRLNLIKPALLILFILFQSSVGAAAQETQKLKLAQLQQQLASGQVNRVWQQIQGLHDHPWLEQQSTADRIDFLMLAAETAVYKQEISTAGTMLNKAWALIEKSGDEKQRAQLSQRFALWFSVQGKTQKATEWFLKAAEYAGHAKEAELEIVALLNLQRYQQTHAFSDIASLIQTVPNISKRHDYLLSLIDIAKARETEFAFSQARHLLEHDQFKRLSARQKAQLYASLAELYASDQQWKSALNLIQQSILLDSSEALLIRWQTLKAQWLEQTGKTELALQSYRRAVEHIQAIRQDIPVYYADGRSSFRETLAPVYLGLINLILNKDLETDSQTSLKEVQTLWEQFKSAELNDYFKAICAGFQNTEAELAQTDQNNAIIYPIIFPDRLEILLNIQDQFWRFKSDVSSDMLDKTVGWTYQQIVNLQDSAANQLLYRWIMQPLLPVLEQNQIKNIIYIPDGVLRKIPLNLLSDGQKYVIDDYLVVTNPGISMLPVDNTVKPKNKILLAGMSEPGDVVNELLDKNIINFDIAESGERVLTRDLSPAQRKARLGELNRFLSLPGVKKELAALSDILETPALENDQFSYESFSQRVLEGQNIIHIASHGFFSGDPEKSFIMTHDRLLTMNQLLALFQSEAFVDNPVDLVSLSACQTAEGDDRSPLGLSGVVVQAGVKSAIGTLWPVADEPTQQLFVEFYQHYRNHGKSKAEALQLAQHSLKRNQDYQHPYFWSAFILIGDGF